MIVGVFSIVQERPLSNHNGNFEAIFLDLLKIFLFGLKY